MMKETTTPFSYGNESEIREDINSRKFYQFYVGMDIGVRFHVTSCIKFDAFLDHKGIAWKHTKTLKFSSDSTGIAEFLFALKHSKGENVSKKQEVLFDDEIDQPNRPTACVYGMHR
ncbi:hypothetical protein AB1283_15150 [Bacillus sp. S13(2024)]|uniref:hypothetical protein n=1 Tax=unclassified Bacillus (in: firmicutes) TaxID=185979 RepID=UPI003D1A33BF